MTADHSVQLVLDCHTDLGESPVWDARTGRLYFVDINEKRIHVYTPADKNHFTIDAPVSSVSSLALLLCLLHKFMSFHSLLSVDQSAQVPHSLVDHI